MKIRLLLLDSDKNYLNRITASFTTKYADEVEIYSFSDLEIAMEKLSSARVDVFLADETFSIDVSRVPGRCSFAYLVETSSIDRIRGQKAFAKYQKIGLFHKQLLNLCAENPMADVSFRTNTGEQAQVLLFLPVSGGAGGSSMAAALAMYGAKRGKKVLYLNLEQFGSADAFFQGEGQADFGEAIYAVKSGKGNLAMKLKSIVRQDLSGVEFFSSPRDAMNLTELDGRDIVGLLQELGSDGTYDAIVLDMDFIFGERLFEVMEAVQNIVFVCTGTENSIRKAERAYGALSIVEAMRESNLLNKSCLVYNRFSSKAGRKIQGLDIRQPGGAPRYENATPKQVIEKLQMLDFWKEFL